jgi:hypothetical protein
MVENLYETYIRNPYAEENIFRTLPPRQESLPEYAAVRTILPQPFWAGHSSAIDCYWKVWELAFRNLRNPTEANGFVSPYIDTAFNGNLFMWDSAFILMFARYAQRAFNFQQTLDNLYSKQHPDGFICREIREKDGADCFKRFDPPATGPNVMPWTEWEYYLQIGDRERLGRVFPPLLAYHQWLRHYRTWQDGTYWASGWSCGMDNQPRLSFHEKPGGRTQVSISDLMSLSQGQMPKIDPSMFTDMFKEWWDHDHMSWIDTSLQAVISARLLILMAEVLGRAEEVADLHDEIKSLSQVINATLWDEETGFYYDRRADGRQSRVKTIGAFWALLAKISPPERVERLVAQLENPQTYNRPHRVPSLAADHESYRSLGEYWRGGVWAPTNYMVLRGLTEAGYHDLAYKIARNHHSQVVQVFEQTGTLWENYAPEKTERGNIAAPNFVGWTGLPPVSVLFEYVFGLRPDVPGNTLVWDVRLLEEHGVAQYPFGQRGLLDLHCPARTTAEEKPVITAHSNVPLNLEVHWAGGVELVESRLAGRASSGPAGT